MSALKFFEVPKIFPCHQRSLRNSLSKRSTSVVAEKEQMMDIEYTYGTTPRGIIAFSRWLSLNGVCEADPRLIFCNA